MFTLGGSRDNAPEGRYRKPRGKFQCRGNGSVGPQSRTGTTQYSTRVEGTYSGRTDCRTTLQSEDYVRTKRAGVASGPKNDYDRCAPRRPYGIQCYNCGLVGHTRSSFPRGQGKNLNGIGRTKTTPPSNLKKSLVQEILLRRQLLRVL